MSLEETKKNIGAFDAAWLQTYRASGRRAYLAKVGENKQSRHDYNLHALKPRTRLLTFLGLPDRLRVKDESFIARDVASTVFGIAMLPFSFVKNTAKLVTEFLPKAGYLGARRMSLHYGRVGFDHHPGKSIAMHALAGMCYGLHFIGRAITSPSQGVRQAFNTRYFSSKNNAGYKPLPLPARIGLALLSGVITAGVYAVLLPFVITLAAPSLIVAGAALMAKSAFVSAAVKGLALVGSFLTKAIGLAYAVAPVVAASSLAITAGTTGCAIASEVDVRRKAMGSTAKMSQHFDGKPGNGVMASENKTEEKQKPPVQSQPVTIVKPNHNDEPRSAVRPGSMG
jgi:hypothetical protein